MPMDAKPCACGVTVWLTGSPGNGAMPLAHALADLLRSAGRQVPYSRQRSRGVPG